MYDTNYIVYKVSLFLSSTSFVSPSQAAHTSGAHPREGSTPQGRWCPQTEQSTPSEPGKKGVEEIGSFCTSWQDDHFIRQLHVITKSRRLQKVTTFHTDYICTWYTCTQTLLRPLAVHG